MLVQDLKALDPSFEIIKGDATHVKLSGISHSEDPQKGSFCFVKNKKFLETLGQDSKESSFLETGLILEASFADKIEAQINDLAKKFKWVGKVENVSHAMCFFSKPFYDAKFSHLNYFVDGRQMGEAHVSPHADIAQNVFIGVNVKIADRVQIYPGAVIMPEVEIGEGSIIYPGAVIYPYTKIGKNCRIHAATVIGADGFGYNFFNGAHQKVWHFSGVEIGDEVEIGASSTIDAGAFTPTRIGSGSKIDNGVQVGHNAHLGKHVILCGQAGVAGSVTLEDYVVLAANSGVAPGSRVGQGSVLAARAAVGENTTWPAGSKLGGFPAENFNNWLKQKAAIRKLIKK